jgi:hypothetical protein
MKKLSLSQWAQVAEISGTFAVVISLITVVWSINQNTAAMSARGVDDIYDGWRDIQMVLSSNSELHEITFRGQHTPELLSGIELDRYEVYVGMCLDLWDRLHQRVSDGMIDEQTAAPWDEYFAEWTRRSVTRQQWELWKWGWTSSDFIARVESVLDH